MWGTHEIAEPRDHGHEHRFLEDTAGEAERDGVEGTADKKIDGVIEDRGEQKLKSEGQGDEGIETGPDEKEQREIREGKKLLLIYIPLRYFDKSILLPNTAASMFDLISILLSYL